MSPARNGNTALQRFKRGNAFAIHNGIMFDFYLGLPHMRIQCVHWSCYNALYTERHTTDVRIKTMYIRTLGFNLLLWGWQ